MTLSGGIENAGCPLMSTLKETFIVLLLKFSTVLGYLVFQPFLQKKYFKFSPSRNF